MLSAAIYEWHFKNWIPGPLAASGQSLTTARLQDTRYNLFIRKSIKDIRNIIKDNVQEREKRMKN